MNGVGVLNSNSQMKEYGKGVTMPAQPLFLESRIRNLEIDIKAIVQMRAWNYKIGDLYGARLQAVRIGVKRAQLRQMKAGM